MPTATSTSPGGVPQLNIEFLFQLLYELLTTDRSGEGIIAFFEKTLFFLNIVGTILVPLLIAAIVYTVIRMWQLRKWDEEQFEEKVRRAKLETKGDDRWQRLVELANSDNPTEWRHAIIEADVILDELLKERGYFGENLGERLRVVDREQFQTLDQAWEAHKVRNQIAHEGSDFILTQREARRVLDLYREVFQEFGVV